MARTRAPEHTLESVAEGAALESMPDPMVVADREGRVLLVNRAARDMLSAIGENVEIGSNIVEAHRNFSEGAGRELAELIRQTCDHPTLASATIPIDMKGRAAVEVSARALGEENDSVLFVLHDVTEHVLIEQQLTESIERLRKSKRLAREQHDRLKLQASLLDLSHDAIFVRNLEGHITFWARGAQELYGWTAEEALGKDALELLATEFPESSRSEAFDMMMSRGRWEGTVHQHTRDGRRLVLSSRWVLHSEDSDGPVEILETNTDITAQAEAISEMERAHVELQMRVEELEEYNKQITLLGEMGELMQNCPNAEEAFDVAQHYIPRLFPRSGPGALYVVDPSRDGVARAASWNETDGLPVDFGFHDCWALRRSQAHIVGDPSSDMLCNHVVNTEGEVRCIPAPYACLPLVAQGEILGVLYMQISSATWIASGEDEHGFRLLRGVAEQLALTIANLRMRESLQNLSVRDHLTGLYNRRFMEASFEREIGRAERDGIQVALIMLDLDEFKQFNDAHGHEAGDDALRGLGELLRNETRPEDIVCRYGGEEFVVILPGAGLSVAVDRAEELRAAICTNRLCSAGDGIITASFGVAAFPEHGNSLERLLYEADMALYGAKSAGRDSVRVATVGARGAEGQDDGSVLRSAYPAISTTSNVTSQTSENSNGAPSR